MKKDYDFSKGERGKFYHPDAQLNIPVYLDSAVRTYLAARAKSKDIELNQLVNELLRKDISLIKSVE